MDNLERYSLLAECLREAGLMRKRTWWQKFFGHFLSNYSWGTWAGHVVADATERFDTKMRG